MRTNEPNQPAPTHMGTTFVFRPQLSDPLRSGTSVLDLAIYRSTMKQVDLARLSISSTGTTTAQPKSMGRRGSGLTEMMKAKVGIGGSDLDVTSLIKVTWVLPSGKEGVVLPPCPPKQEIAFPSLK